ncbi:MAG: hypothetical protein KI793_11590 [Rivularia sp. (in: Bacteria)]|nr:hypothetical protein [Rivularia sp. MS3]
MENYFNLYTIFRLGLFGVTIYGTFQLIANLLRYKPYYDRIPKPVKGFLFATGGALIERKFKQHKHDFVINGVLLAVLIALNGILFFFA